MRQSLEEVLSIGQLIGSVKIAKVLAGMLDKAEPNSEFKMIENEQF